MVIGLDNILAYSFKDNESGSGLDSLIIKVLLSDYSFG
jgi:hypothetical protein